MSIPELRAEIQRIIGRTLPDQHLRELLGLRPLNTRSLSRLFQAKARIQLKKGQSDHIAQAIHRAREGTVEKPAPASPASPPELDPDLPALATREGAELARVVNGVLRDVQFDRIHRDLRLRPYGGDYDVRPFPLPVSAVDIQGMKLQLREAVKASRTRVEATRARRAQQAFSFFMFGEALNRKVLEDLFGEGHTASIDQGIRLGLFVNAAGQGIRMSGLSLFSRRLHNGEAIYVFADTPPHFRTRTADQRVYIGADSYQLMDRVSEMSPISGYCVEMGSGSGVQLITAVKQHPAITRAIGKETDRRAVHVSLFNAALNGVDDRMVVFEEDGDVRAALQGHAVSFAMTNPPFLAMPADLRAAFPQAGWGGEDGLQVTREFVSTLLPLLGPETQLVIYSQFAGDQEAPTVVQRYLQSLEGCRFAFEPARSRTLVTNQPSTNRLVEGRTQTVFTVDQTAGLVARLVVAAAAARQEPGRVRLAVRKGGAEHALLVDCAGRIEQSYRSQGITHFHDGFAILTRQNAS